MNRVRWQRASEIFSAALDLPESARDGFIAASCGPDAELRHHVEQMIQDDQEAEQAGFLTKTPSAFKGLIEQGRAADANTSGPCLQPGDSLVNRYRIDSLLGHGGMGEVYRAMDLELGVPIALKTIRPEIASDPASLRRFKQEVLLARSVSHPNVCRIYDLGRDETKDVSFLTMEYLSGETLASRIQEKGALEPGAALLLVRQLSEGLDAAHRAGIVHRDFKSANIMLIPADSGERAVITDFGLAVTVGAAPRAEPSDDAETQWSSAHARSQVFDLVGTPAYMSPEQVQGGHVGTSSDLYALGVVLYEMSTGRLPFQGSDPMETALAHLHQDPPSPSTFAHVDPEWERSILRCLSKQPAERYRSARDVVLALEGQFTGDTEFRYSLPAERDAFVGRTTELEALALQLEESNAGQAPGSAAHSASRAHLVTVWGLGGIGKTRLAVRYAWESLARWPGGVWFCDLSDARSVEGIVLAVATALNVPLGKTDPIVQLGHAMAGRGRSLVILDNFEQVADHAESTLSKWLERATTTSFLVTSRERLNVPGEATYDLEPLAPATQGMELFEVRAQGHRPGFVVDEGNRKLVRELVAVLDGLPLAIELATSRLGMLSLDQLRDRLGDRFRTLSGGHRGRHATLRATMDWSWDLLHPWERAALAQASVFEGGFTLDAAEAVIDIHGWPGAPSVLDVVQSLVNKSWLRMRAALQAPRFGMYVTVQEYASERLRADQAAAGFATGLAPRQGAEKRHGTYYTTMGTEEAVEALDRHGGVSKRAALHLEIDNLVAACRRAMDRVDAETAVGAFAASCEVFFLTGPVAASVDLGQIVTKIPELQPAERARAMELLGKALRLAGGMEEARLNMEAALVVYREVGNRRFESGVLCNLGTLHREQGRTEEARQYYEDALVILREVGYRRFEGVVLANLGILHLGQYRMEEARRHMEDALVVTREVGNRMLEGIVLGNLGILQRHEGRTEDARLNMEDALAIHRELGNRWSEGVVLGNLGLLHRDQGRMEEARRQYEDALAIHREVGNRRFEGVVLGYLGRLYRDQGRMDEARQYYEDALAIHREVGNRWSEGDVLGNLGLLHCDQGRMEEARRHLEEALAIHREVGDRRSAGASLSWLGRIFLEQGRIEQARRHLDEGIALLREVGERLEHGKFLCISGELERRQANLAAAQSALAEAEAIAESLAVTSDSELVREIAKLRRALTNDET